MQVFLAQFIVVVAFRMELVFTNVYKTLNYMSGRQFCWFNKEISSAKIWDKNKQREVNYFREDDKSIDQSIQPIQKMEQMKI